VNAGVQQELLMRRRRRSRFRAIRMPLRSGHALAPIHPGSHRRPLRGQQTFIAIGAVDAPWNYDGGVAIAS
jgi:hypothetical protein